MQRDDRLARSRAASDDGHATVRRTNRLVLLGLDGADNVFHLSTASARDGSHEGAFAEDLQIGVRLAVEEIILDTSHLVVAAAKHASTNDFHGGDLRRAVEGLGGRRAPVDDQWFVVVVPDADAADVADLAVVQIETAEHESFMFGVEDGQPLRRLVGERVALEQRGPVLLAEEIGSVRDEDLSTLTRQFFCTLSSHIEVGIHTVDVCLLLRDLLLQRVTRYGQWVVLTDLAWQTSLSRCRQLPI